MPEGVWRPVEGEDFPGTERFQVERRLGQGGMGVVYQAYDRAWNQRVALKTLHNVDAAGLLRLKREFRSLADVSHPNLVTLYELVSSGGRWFFTMELLDGVDFLTYVRESEASPPGGAGSSQAVSTSDTEAVSVGPFLEDPRERHTDPNPLVEAITVAGPPAASRASRARLERLRPAAARLAEALVAVHTSGHLHRDVKSSNVMVTSQGRVVVLDFGVTTELAPTRHSLVPRGRAGTAGYMAPEVILSGARASTASDWYSFGVMLYEALAGRRPFPARGEAILAAKLGRDPPPPSSVRSGIPEDLDQLCRDLLRSDPRQRPDGAEILERLGVAAEVSSSDHVFVKNASASARDTFVGRQAQLAVLGDALAQVRAGKGRAVFLCGRSGMGKSALARHFLDRVDDAVVLEGRCYERESVPYKALDGIVDALCIHLACQPEQELAALLPPDSPALVHAFPVLRRLRGLPDLTEDDFAEVTPSEQRRRAFAALRELLDRLAKRRALVLFIDDLQWGDAESAPLLLELMQTPAAPLLLLGTYRSEELQSSPLLQALSTAREGDPELAANVQEVAIDRLTGEECGLLIRSLLAEAGASERAADLLEQIVSESEGNPFFMQEFVRFALPRAPQQLGGMGLETMILQRVAELSPAGRRLLEIVAVAGWRLPQRVAQEAAALTEERLRALAELRAGQFVRTDGTGEHACVESYHDRVREAVLTLLDAQEQQEVHARLADALERRMEEGPDKVYALANHYYLGGADEQRERAFELNYAAGRMAFDAFAYERSYRFLAQAHELAQAIGLEEEARLHQLLGEACARTGRVGRALGFFEQALERSTDPRQRARIGYSVSKIHLGRLDAPAARSHVADALAELGHRKPGRSLSDVVAALAAWIGGWWVLHRQGRVPALPAERKEEYHVAASLYMQAAYTAYFEMDPLRMALDALRAYGTAARTGRSQELAMSYALVAGMLAAKGWARTGVRLAEKAVAVAAALNNPVLSARTHVMRAFVAHFIGDTKNARERAERALETYARLLENVDYFTGVADLSWNLLMRGYAKDGWQWAERGLRRAALSGRSAAVTQGHTYRCYVGPLLTLIGRHGEGMRHLDEFCQVIADTSHDKWRRGQYLAHRALSLVLAGEIGPPLDDLLARHRALELVPGRVPLQLRQFYVAQAYARLWQYRAADESTRAAARRRYRRAMRQLKRTGFHPTLRAHQLCIEAGFKTHEGRIRKALALLRGARELATRTDNPWVLAEADYQHAHILRRQGQEAQAQQKARGMLRFARELGWQQRVEQVRAEFDCDAQ